MKKRLLILFILSVIFYLPPFGGGLGWGCLSSLQAQTPLLDSIVTKDGAGNYVKLEQHFYNANNQDINTVIYQWTNGVKKGTSNTYKVYDDAKKEVMSLTLGWDASVGDWTSTSSTRTENVYNAQGKQSAQIKYTWNAAKQEWYANNVTEYGYTSGKQTMVRSSKLVNGKMTYSTLYEYHFDAQGTAVGTDYYSSYNTTTNQWVGSSRTVQEYTYIPKKLKTLDETYSWANNDWQVSKRQIWEFDSKGNQLNTENYSKWSGGQCTNGSKTVQEFNANNRVIMKETFSWNKTKQDWVESSKAITEYDGSTANKTLEESYSWSKDHYVGQSRVRTTYSGGKAISVTNYTWDDTNREWIESEKNENTYSGSTLTQTSSLKLENGVWVGYRTIYTYTSGKLTESLTQRFDDPNWVDYTRIRNEYNGSTNVGTYEETWNGTQWVLNKKTWTVLNYDERGNKIEEAYYDSIPGLKTGSARFTYEYNADKRVTLSQHFVWFNNQWTNDWKHEYDYAAGCGDKKTLDAYSYWQNSAWVGSTKSETIYDENCQQVISASYKWNTNPDYPRDWEGLTKSETLKSTSQETQSISYKWDYNHWSWTGMFRYNHYLQNGKDTLYIVERYDESVYPYNESGWYNSEKYVYQYDSKGQQIYTEEFNWIDGVWVSRKLSKKTYDPTTGKIRQTVDTNNGVTTISDYFYSTDPK